jgi:MYXO-CTERM domain-containing protein
MCFHKNTCDTGGGLMALGTVLAAFPGRRRRKPTSPTSEDDFADDLLVML